MKRLDGLRPVSREFEGASGLIQHLSVPGGRKIGACQGFEGSCGIFIAPEPEVAAGQGVMAIERFSLVDVSGGGQLDLGVSEMLNGDFEFAVIVEGEPEE